MQSAATKSAAAAAATALQQSFHQHVPLGYMGAPSGPGGYMGAPSGPGGSFSMRPVMSSIMPMGTSMQPFMQQLQGGSHTSNIAGQQEQQQQQQQQLEAQVQLSNGLFGDCSFDGPRSKLMRTERGGDISYGGVSHNGELSYKAGEVFSYSADKVSYAHALGYELPQSEVEDIQPPVSHDEEWRQYQQQQQHQHHAPQQQQHQQQQQLFTPASDSDRQPAVCASAQGNGSERAHSQKRRRVPPGAEPLYNGPRGVGATGPPPVHPVHPGRLSPLHHEVRGPGLAHTLLLGLAEGC